MRNFNDVHDRNRRRKQSKADRFKKEHLNSGTNETKYDLPAVSKYRLHKLKEDIRSKIKKENRKNLILSILISLLVFYLLYYFFVK